MPTLSARFPSFQLALLKPELQREGIPVQTFSLFMYFGTQVGWRINETLSDVYPCMLGEWIWTKAAFGDFAPEDEYFEIYRDNLEGICAHAGCSLSDLSLIRDKRAPEFIDFCLESIDWTRFGLIGFSVVFQQTLASDDFTAARLMEGANIQLVVLDTYNGQQIWRKNFVTSQQKYPMNCVLAPDGMLILMEGDPVRADQARRCFSASALAGRATVIAGDPRRMLYKLAGPFDLAFIDALKPEYERYLEALHHSKS